MDAIDHSPELFWLLLSLFLVSRGFELRASTGQIPCSQKGVEKDSAIIFLIVTLTSWDY